ncbi:MAG TPA: SAM-dependent methyltransferase [Casimicrobiaceae bacterium]|nr:SAM-dependent methyltransferase [Casimicrobiaceae bacterium]
MRFVLYEPGLGYYVSGAAKFGSPGDFVTAPELTPLFARTVSTQIAALLAATDGDVVELGAGSGVFAANLLAALADNRMLPARYRILEPSPELRVRQRATLETRVPALLGHVEWLDELPDSIRGVVLMNEVLDAIPVHIVARRSGVWFERGVKVEHGELAFDDSPLDNAMLQALASQRFPEAIDYASELNPSAEALVETLGGRLNAGALIAFDYGFPRHEYYHPQRNEGTLMVHYRHRAFADPFVWPGLSDMTAHVDFTAIAEAGVRAGLDVAGYTSQGALLLGLGILERLAEIGAPDSVEYMRGAAAVNTLVSPSEMGELLKVLALARGEGFSWPGFAMTDRRERL